MAALPDVIGRSRFTRDDVRVMEEKGLLTGRWELIAGELINSMGENPPHSWVEMKQEYAERLPRGDELALVIEVANTSSRIDLSTKARLYARCGVPEYWVVDIAKRRVVLHRQAEKESYALVESLAEDQSLSLEGSSLTISSFLPRALADQ